VPAVAADGGSAEGGVEFRAGTDGGGYTGSEPQGIALNEEVDIEGRMAEKEIAEGAADEVGRDAACLSERYGRPYGRSSAWGEGGEPFIDKFWVFPHVTSLL
jgi:hypothetical protein